MSSRSIKPPKGAVKKKRIVGRGDSAGKGSTCGRGHKGQKARSGGGVRPGFEGGQMPLYRRVARRGFSNYPFKKIYTVISLSSLESKFSEGEVVDLASLRERKLIKNSDVYVKILGTGEITKKLIVKDVKVSKSAKTMIEKAGGEIALAEDAVKADEKNTKKAKQNDTENKEG